MIQTPVAIIGMGKSGRSAHRLLLHCGFDPQQVLTFDNHANAQFNEPQALMRDGKPKTLVVSPGVPLSSSWIQEAVQNGVTLTSEINLACEYLTTEKVIGVTGSLGKSTTVSLLGAGLLAFDPNGFVGGNLGTPFCDYVYDLLTGRRKTALWVILELSSYQLENSPSLQLEHSAITYLSANHLERYRSLESYYQTKWKIVSITKGFVFLNKNGGDLVSFAEKQAEFSRCIVCSKDDKALQPHALSHAELLGKHNQDNLALAAKIALLCHWPISALQAMKAFKGLEHRLENLGIFEGIRYVNDSKATTMDSVITAVNVAHETLVPAGKLFVLLGGKDKNLPWELLRSLKKKSNTHFLFFGQCRQLAQQKSELVGESFPSLDLALDAVFMKASEGDTVLLSPGGVSFDEFKSFEDRGRFFKEKVRSFYSNTR